MKKLFAVILLITAALILTAAAGAETAELSDESFLEDISAAITARWDTPDPDPGQASDTEVKEHILKLVDTELEYLSKYAEFGFTDERLGNYARVYLQAVKTQRVAVAEFYGNNPNQYKEMWSEGYQLRANCIYLLIRDYGLTVPARHQDTLDDMAAVGYFVNMGSEIRNTICEQLSHVEIRVTEEGDGRRVEIPEFEFGNPCETMMDDLTVLVFFVDDQENVIDCIRIISCTDLASGECLLTENVSTVLRYEHLFFAYSFIVDAGRFYDSIEGVYVPEVNMDMD